MKAMIKTFLSGILKVSKPDLLAVSLFLLLTPAVYSDIPELPGWIDKVFYFDPENSEAGDGSVENPWNSIESIPAAYYSTDWPRLGWDHPRSAILFKRGTVTFEDSPRRTTLRFSADSIYIGSYGSGPAAKLLFDSGSRALRVDGHKNTISHLHVSNLDTLAFSEVVSVRGNQDTSRESEVRIDSLIISNGYRGLVFGNLRKAEIFNSLIYNVHHDAVYISDSDSIIFHTTHFHTINKEWVVNRSGDVSGGDIIQAEGVAGSRIRYLEVDRCILDYTYYGGKFGIIANFTDTTIVRNSQFLGHPLAQAGIRATRALVENSYFQGFTHALWNIGSDTGFAVRNSVFKGFGKDFVFEGEPLDPPYLRGNFTEFYSNTVIFTNEVFRFPSRNINARNNIFYEVGRVYNTGVRAYHASSNIHWYPDSPQPSLSRYDEDHPPVFDDPGFINPVVNWIHHVEIEGTGDGAWSWYELENKPDLRVEEGSPAIDSADPRIWEHPDSLFLFGDNNTNHFGTSSDGDPVFYRRFAEFYISHTDKDGHRRPHGEGYDIGAYEFGSEPVTIAPGIRPYINEVLIFPNPARNRLTVKLTDSEFGGTTVLAIYDISGRLVSNHVYPEHSGNTYEIPLDNHRPGLYFLRITTSFRPVPAVSFLIID